MFGKTCFFAFDCSVSKSESMYECDNKLDSNCTEVRGIKIKFLKLVSRLGIWKFEHYSLDGWNGMRVYMQCIALESQLYGNGEDVKG